MIALEQQHALKFDQEESLKLTDLIATLIAFAYENHTKKLFFHVFLFIQGCIRLQKAKHYITTDIPVENFEPLHAHALNCV